MEKKLLQQYAALMDSPVDADAVMGLRGAQNFLQEMGCSMEQALLYAYEHREALRAMHRGLEDTVQEADAAPRGAEGIPEFSEAAPGVLAMVHGSSRAECVLPECVQAEAAAVAVAMKDAVVAALINKCRMKIKLCDVQDEEGQTVATVVQAEYDRAGMLPIPLWSGTKGEAGAVASVLRPFFAKHMSGIYG